MDSKYNLNYKNKFDFNDLVDIMNILRGNNGCPWDMEQNHKSIRKNLIEETYEVVEAIDNEDKHLLKEELGDVLLQIVFHSKISEQNNEFNINDVTDGIVRKLIYRHPHIFSDVQVKDSNAVLENWDNIKKTEKNHITYTETLNSVPKHLPALMRAYKVQKKAAKASFDWPDINGAIEKVSEEAKEVSTASKDKVFEEFGDLLFSVVNVSRFLDIEPEEALSAATDKFINRFKKLEEQCVGDMKLKSLEELEALWEKVKIKE